MNIGVLALQGDFEAHQRALEELGVKAFQVRSQADFERADALVMPGGESTTMLRILDEEKLEEPLLALAKAGKPILATCAGVILLARETRSPSQRCFGLLDVAVVRNGYGRQLDSSIRRLEPAPAAAGRLGSEPIECVFIRAPIICEAGPAVATLLADGDTPVLVEQGPILGITFHPELTSDRRIHQLFVDKVKASLQ
ncbi:MAG: pyridoxal 5'-phosphate synthase glutaminase subunit PdxT [Acidobacteria bacterium]|nr:pyridoxal 5'-phosphate synthase glutaminase subunit PdxT [Acidobacteriota bacterium]